MRDGKEREGDQGERRGSGRCEGRMDGCKKREKG